MEVVATTGAIRR